ncbi:MAG: hypothetical protein A2378_01370 [Candidatus Pacebacteria bacterium RIFOXYB1_FULL_44_10]|nr:MAG: hypothetical protein A2378_01370 [Candidatus Pacebacteria bacterium RIFOXYB1_FULL_44_10]
MDCAYVSLLWGNCEQCLVRVSTKTKLIHTIHKLIHNIFSVSHTKNVRTIRGRFQTISLFHTTTNTYYFFLYLLLDTMPP